MNDEAFIEWFKETLYEAVAKEFIAKNFGQEYKKSGQYRCRVQKNSSDIVDWITVKGNHIPIKKGQTKQQAVKEFLENKRSDSEDKNKLSEHEQTSLSTVFHLYAHKYGPISSKHLKKITKKLSGIGKVKNPQTIASVKQGKPMTFEEADGGKANPNFKPGTSFAHNCQSCVVAHEARMRGYNVKAAPKGYNYKTEELANNPFEAWIHPLTGRKCKGEQIVSSRSYDLYATLDNKVKQGQRYHFSYVRPNYETQSNVGHIVTIDRDENGNLRLYDPQSNRKFIGREVLQYIEETEMYVDKPDLPVQILRVDNKNFNPYYMNDVLQKY